MGRLDVCRCAGPRGIRCSYFWSLSVIVTLVRPYSSAEHTACRDVAEHAAARFPVFARGISTLVCHTSFLLLETTLTTPQIIESQQGQYPFTRPSAVQVPLKIDAEPAGCDFPSITINPGDFIVADEDGVVCVPANSVAVVIQLAEQGREADARCMVDIKAGLGVRASFKKHRGK